MTQILTEMLAKKVVDTGISKVIESGTRYLFEDMVKEKCVSGILEQVLGQETATRYSPLIPVLFKILDKPKITGDPIVDDQNWIKHVDEIIDMFESRSKKSIELFFSENFKKNFEIQTGQSSEIFNSRDSIKTFLYDVKNYSGLAEAFLKMPLRNFADHSLTIQDRFHSLLPEFILQSAPNIGVRIVGDVEAQPALNLKNLNIKGFVYYNDTQKDKQNLSRNPFEQIIGDRKVYDGDANVIIEYAYYGPGNPMTQEYIDSHPPINLLDSFGFEHDKVYNQYGYNTPEAKESDRVLVNQIKKAIAENKINENSPYEELKRAKIGLNYFSTIDIK